MSHRYHRYLPVTPSPTRSIWAVSRVGGNKELLQTRVCTAPISPSCFSRNGTTGAGGTCVRDPRPQSLPPHRPLRRPPSPRTPCRRGSTGAGHWAAGACHVYGSFHNCSHSSPAFAFPHTLQHPRICTYRKVPLGTAPATDRVQHMSVSTTLSLGKAVPAPCVFRSSDLTAERPQRKQWQAPRAAFPGVRSAGPAHIVRFHRVEALVDDNTDFLIWLSSVSLPARSHEADFFTRGLRLYPAASISPLTHFRSLGRCRGTICTDDPAVCGESSSDASLPIRVSFSLVLSPGCTARTPRT